MKEYRRPVTGPFTLNRDSLHAQGLVAWYPLDWRHGLNAWDASLNSYPQTASGISWVTDPVMGRVPSFSGSAYFERSGAILTGDPIAMFGWFNRSQSYNQNICSISTSGLYTQCWYLRTLADGTIGGVKANNSVSAFGTTSTTNIGEWYLGAAQFFHATLRKIYFNAVEEGSSTSNKTDGTGMDFTSIGRIAAPGYYWYGQLADVRIYNRTFSNQEMLTFYEPRTRWELYYELGKKTYFVIEAGPPPTTKNYYGGGLANARRLTRGFGWTG